MVRLRFCRDSSVIKQYWANVEARVFRFQDGVSNGYDPPASTDQALLQRLTEEEEKDILGRAAFDTQKTFVAVA